MDPRFFVARYYIIYHPSFIIYGQVLLGNHSSFITYHSWHGVGWTNLGALLKAARRMVQDGRYADDRPCLRRD